MNRHPLPQPVVRMASGRDVPLHGPCPADIDLRDIAHHLAQINRFNGAPHVPYSVAQHSVLVAQILQGRRQPPDVVLLGLLHDAHEAYQGDIITPVKQRLFGLAEAAVSNWDDLTTSFDAAILARFGLAPDASQRREVMLADMTALATEWRDLMPGPCPVAAAPLPSPVRPLNWSRAEDRFVDCYNSLSPHLNLEPA
jgi:hypothetical protein